VLPAIFISSYDSTGLGRDMKYAYRIFSFL